MKSREMMRESRRSIMGVQEPRFPALLLVLTSVCTSCACSLAPGVKPQAALVPAETQPEKPSNAKVQEYRKRIADLHTKRKRRESRLAEMSVGQLIEELKRDSDRGFESFNSTAYALLLKKKDQVKQELKAALDKKTFLLGLLALRRLDKDLYRQIHSKIRVTILTEALKKSKVFNAWGMPHRHWGEAAKAIIAEGPPARVALQRLFSDKRKARLWGARGWAESEQYKYRVCDYAWALSQAIAKPGEKTKIPMDPKTRDEKISRA